MKATLEVITLNANDVVTASGCPEYIPTIGGGCEVVELEPNP